MYELYLFIGQIFYQFIQIERCLLFFLLFAEIFQINIICNK